MKIAEVLRVSIGPTLMPNEYLPAMRSSGTFQTNEPALGMFSVSMRHVLLERVVAWITSYDIGIFDDILVRSVTKVIVK